MGYSIMLDPKDEKFICQEPCEHGDCKSLREFVKNAVCKNCGKPITKGQYYYGSKPDELQHIACNI